MRAHSSDKYNLKLILSKIPIYHFNNDHVSVIGNITISGIILSGRNFLSQGKYFYSVTFSLSIYLLQSGTSFFNPLRKQDPKVLSEKSYFPHAPQSGAKKEKASLFSMSQASVFRANEMQRSQQSLVSGVSFPKQVPGLLLASLACADLASAPQGAVGAHTGWKNKAGTLKKRVF